ncbi:MAG: arginase family protein [Bacteroidales bacterium]|nr:arginase family protein [Bacteroidales bacterium]MDD3384665.1 arginase family protein [Bacteroidales bacterium]MDD3810782.1 arginase family protein [Bacteroidales bacterium]MDD3871040.1 arginase family protein [Bacteroidales bacterium]MDD4812760.1 arginase family protein [Bacteroidales bacterium]
MNSSTEILLYFEPPGRIPIVTDDRITSALGSNIAIHRTKKSTLNLRKAKIVLIGAGNPLAANQIRSYLFGLSALMPKGLVADLGNFREGKTPADTRAGLADVITELGKAGKIVVLLGTGMHLMPVVGKAYNRLEVPFNLTVVDSRIDLMTPENSDKSLYLNEMVTDPEGRLFDFCHLGHQAYLNDPLVTDRLGELLFDHYRLGILREDLREAEPVMRNSDIAFFSLSSVRQPEAPGTTFPSANGFTGEEACQLARYAGLSDRLTLLALTDYEPARDTSGQTAGLAAQLIWFFLQGVSQRKAEYPFTDIKDYQKYTVNLAQSGHELVFFKSPLSNRWWMQVPYPDPKYQRSVIIACSLRDYQTACDGDIPDRWLNTYRRL